MARRGQDNIAAERQKVVRQRFRSLIRSVMYNRIWLADDDEQKKIVLNVRRNVAMLVRPRHKIGVLTMAEKGLIRCPHSLRSTEDRKTLLKLITNLECFRNFSPQIRARLIPVIKFVYLEAGRKIIKEGGFANTIYFILYGEVEASRRVFDSYKGSYVEKIEFIYSSGDCIGEIELIEGTLRTHNYTATSAVELLVVFEHDFDQILRAVMTKQWFQKKAALKAIGYFDHFSEEQFISATKLSALREFDALETIYHEDLGEASHAYFVLSGECMILQSLQLQVIENRYTRTYELLALNSTSAARTDIQNPNTHKGEALRKNSLMEEQNDSNTDYYSEINEINFALQSIRTKSIVEDIHRSLTEEINTHEDFSIESNVECEGSEEMGESMEALEVGINLQTSDDRTKVATSSPRNEESVNMLSENRRDQVQQSQAEKGESCSEEERKSVNSSSQKAALSVDTGFEYSRSGNPTRNVLEKCLAALDNARFGLTFASGLGATTTVLTMLSSGDHIIIGDDVYGGTNRLMRQVATRLGIAISFVDPTNLDDLQKEITKNTKLVWIETPTNPMMKVADIQAVCDLCHRFENIIVAVDNTFLTPYLQRPLEFGADMVCYSLTKYMNGHTDVVMGAITMNSEELYQRLKFLQNATGIVPSPFDCYLVNRSLKTLALRMEQHQKSSIEVAKFLESHSFVISVLHPALPSHPQHEIALRQTYGYSGVFSFYLKGKSENANAFVKALKIFALAESLGGYESLVEIPSIMTHASVPKEDRDKLGITDSLIRLSVGLEDVKDLILDLTNALEEATKIKDHNQESY